MAGAVRPGRPDADRPARGGAGALHGRADRPDRAVRLRGQAGRHGPHPAGGRGTVHRQPERHRQGPGRQRDRRDGRPAPPGGRQPAGVAAGRGEPAGRRKARRTGQPAEWRSRRAGQPARAGPASRPAGREAAAQ